MRRNSLFLAYAGPGASTFVGIVILLAHPHGWVSIVPLGLALVTAPLWPLRGLKENEDTAQRSDFVDALNFELSVIVVLVIGAVLMLFFIGLFVLVVAVFMQLLVNFTAAWRIRSGEPVELPRRPIQFVK